MWRVATHLRIMLDCHCCQGWTKGSLALNLRRGRSWRRSTWWDSFGRTNNADLFWLAFQRGRRPFQCALLLLLLLVKCGQIRCWLERGWPWRLSSFCFEVFYLEKNIRSNLRPLTRYFIGWSRLLGVFVYLEQLAPHGFNGFRDITQTNILQHLDFHRFRDTRNSNYIISCQHQSARIHKVDYLLHVVIGEAAQVDNAKLLARSVELEQNEHYMGPKSWNKFRKWLCYHSLAELLRKIKLTFSRLMHSVRSLPA